MPYVPEWLAGCARAAHIFARIRPPPGPVGQQSRPMVPNASAEFRALVEKYSDPYLKQTLGNAQAVETAEIRDDRALISIVLGFPIGGYEDEFAAGLRAHLALAGVTVPIDMRLRAQIAS